VNADPSQFETGNGQKGMCEGKKKGDPGIGGEIGGHVLERKGGFSRVALGTDEIGRRRNC